jgi:hypothetical protein
MRPGQALLDTLDNLLSLEAQYQRPQLSQRIDCASCQEKSLGR